MSDFFINTFVTVVGCIGTYFFTIAHVRQDLRRTEVVDLIFEVNSIHNDVVFIMAEGATHSNAERMREARSIISRFSDASGRISHLKLSARKKRNIEVLFVEFKKSATGVGTNFESANYVPIPVTDRYFVRMETCKQHLNESLRVARDINFLGL